MDVKGISIFDAKEVSISPIKYTEKEEYKYRIINIDGDLIHVFFDKDSNGLLTLECENE